MAVILGLDACEFSLGLALYQSSGETFQRVVEDTSIAENIVDEIDLLLRDANCSKSQLTLIAVAIGPGSFSGIRTSIASALGMNKALGIPTIGIPTLLGRFFGNSNNISDGVYLISMTANRSESFCSLALLSRNLTEQTEGLHDEKLVVKAIGQPFCCSSDISPNEALQSPGCFDLECDQPLANISYFKADKQHLKVSPALSTALAGKALASHGKPYSEQLRPLYIKGVNAKTISERRLEKGI